MRQTQIRKGYTKSGKRIVRKDNEPIRQEYYDSDIRRAKYAARKGK